jgi:hypothetical protein
VSGRQKIKEYPHILPSGKLRHCVKTESSKTVFISKKNRFHEVILSPTGALVSPLLFLNVFVCCVSLRTFVDPGAFFANHKYTFPENQKHIQSA